MVGRVSGHPAQWSFRATLLFWWIAFLLMQQAERVFLLPEAIAIEVPEMSVLAKTLLTGLRADLIVSTIGMVLAMGLAVICWAPAAVVLLVRELRVDASAYQRWLKRTALLVGLFIIGFVTVDMGYYGYSRQHLDFVFFDYIDDLIAPTSEQVDAEAQTGVLESQAFQQTEAELKEAGKWGGRLVGFFLVLSVAVLLWWKAFRRIVAPALARWESVSPRATTAMFFIALVIGMTGLHPKGPWAIARVGIDSSVYYMLAQNPLWYGGDVLFASLTDKARAASSGVFDTMPLPTAIQVTRDSLAPGGDFPYPSYPLVRKAGADPSDRLEPLPNVLVLFIEGLDRRFLGRTLVLGSGSGKESTLLPDAFSAQSPPGLGSGGQAISLTPFLDRLKDRSLYFENFFSNGAQTHHGMFSTFCSYYARYGRAAIKALYTYDYMCLPTVLRRAGYRTEMAIGHNRDYHQDHTAMFMARNGLHRFFDENDFPPDAERLGLGLTDGALFDFLRTRIEVLRSSGEPFFLTTLTLSTHHPYEIPQRHPDVRALQALPDRYLASLRYLDAEFERFFTALGRDGLLENTMVFVLGDHGRHEGVGRGEVERWTGHFKPALLIWVDKSLGEQIGFRPRVVSSIASHVDVTPTVLGLAGLSPRVSPFLGRDLSCVLTSDCLQDNMAFLSRGHGGMIALVDPDGYLLYRPGADFLLMSDLQLEGPEERRAVTDPDIAERYRRLISLFISSNVLLEENRVWSWRELGDTLSRREPGKFRPS